MAQKLVIPKNKLRNSGAETYFVSHWSKLDAFCKFTNFIQKCIVCPLVTIGSLLVFTVVKFTSCK